MTYIFYSLYRMLPDFFSASKLIHMNGDIQHYSTDPWITHMKSGAFEKAWLCSDASLLLNAGKACWHLPRHFQHIWNGGSLEGKKVLIRCYHGLGDTIQFIRYAVLVKKIAKEVIVWAQPTLIPLLKTAKGIDQLLSLHDGTPNIAYDIDVEIMELPYIFRTNPATIPLRIPYLSVKPLRLPAGDNLLRVGLVWKAGDWDEGRNIPFNLFEPLSLIKGVQLFIVQANAVSAGWQSGFGLNACQYNLYHDARIIAGLHLMISIDSMPVHLAGALGIPVWNLLQANADWRWMEEREDSPWYSTMRLFRQTEPGKWEHVIEQVVRELEAKVREFRRDNK